MTLFVLFAQIQIGSKVTAQFFYHLAIFCASHRALIIALSISIFLLVCYPTFDTYYLNPAKDVSDTHFFWEVPSSRSQISKETFVKKYGIKPSFRVEQVIIKIANSKEYNKGSNIGVLEKDLLLWTLCLQERIMNTVVMYSNQPSSLDAKEYTLSDLCLKPLDSNACLTYSPLDYWSNNASHLFSDPSILQTLSITNKTSSLGMPVPLNTVFGNAVYKKKKIVSADSIILTYFLKGMEDCNESQIMAIWEAIWKQIINDTDTTFRLGDDHIISVNMDHQGKREHLSFNSDRNGSLAKHALLMLAYLIFPLFTLYSARLDSIRSKSGLIFSAVAHVFASLIMSFSICSRFEITLTFASVSWKLLPFIFILIGIENTLILTNAVTTIPMQLNVEERVAKGLEKVGYTITKMLISWILVLLIFSVTNIDSIQEFCIFTSIAMIIDYMLQITFFIAVLSIDLQWFALETICTYCNDNENTNKNVIPSSKTANYGRRIGGLLVVLIFLVAVTNVHYTNIEFTNIEFPYLKSALSSLIDNFIDVLATQTNITFWELSTDKTANEFWSIVNLDKKDQFVEILPTRHLTLSYDIEQDDMFHPFDGDINWRLSIRTYIKTFVWSLKFIIFPAIGLIFTMPVLMGFTSLENLVIRVKKTNTDRYENMSTSLPSESSSLYNITPQIITLRGRHSSDLDFLCANFNGIIITSATDRHITSWDGTQGTPLKKLERYMRRCSTCKCDSTGGLKGCISWPVRAMCMSEKIAAAGFEDGVVRVWDVNLGQAIYILKDTVEDVEQIMPSINNDKSINERVTCLQIITPTLHSYDHKAKNLLDEEVPAILLATYRNGYFREWNLISGQISHTVFTHQKGGISYLFVADDEKNKIRIFTGARDGSVKCWIRTVDLDKEPRNCVWKLLYTLPGEFGNAITSVNAKVVKNKKSCFGVLVTGAADGGIRVYDYFTGQYIETLSYGTLGQQKLAKEREEQLLLQQQPTKSKDFSSEQDWFEEYEDEQELWDEPENIELHQDAIISIIIHPLKEESCPCGDVKETKGFLIITSSLDEKVNFWQLSRKFMDCTCVTYNLEESSSNDYFNVDASKRLQKVFLGHIRQPGSSAIVLLKGHITGVRRVMSPNELKKRSHGAEGEWEIWTLNINDPRVFESTEEIDNSENHDHDDEFKIKTIPLVSDNDLLMEEQQKNKKEMYKKDRENVERLKGFVGRRKDVSMTNGNYVLNSLLPSNDHTENHSHIHNVQGQVMDFRQRSPRQSVYPNYSNIDRKSSTLKDEDEMNAILPFAHIRRIVKVGEDGIAVTYGNFAKVILFKELND
ncbi:WD40 repeat-like protein [Gigaspora margarita]|uniref:Sterol regulatory element-binding protein cleavage-activating protein n=2 Tax=Gigaspora margarita TaxID=4874 RepID=A0A8H4AEG5_GIGMA|nr:WD40 repeat-like protein [Gigaspora margarita]